jgi:septin family protein
VQAKHHQASRPQVDDTHVNKGNQTRSCPEKPKGRRSQTGPAAQPKKQSSPQSDDELEDYSKKAQERNRVASNKFRVKKHEDAKKLRANEENMEQTNRKLSSSLANLTQQVYELKMKLLQHTDCNCHLIQEYIANETNQYIHDLGRR